MIELLDANLYLKIFGWRFNELGIQIQQRRCKFLLDTGNSEAAAVFLQVKDTYTREITTYGELSDWSLGEWSY